MTGRWKEGTIVSSICCGTWFCEEDVVDEISEKETLFWFLDEAYIAAIIESLRFASSPGFRILHGFGFRHFFFVMAVTNQL